MGTNWCRCVLFVAGMLCYSGVCTFKVSTDDSVSASEEAVGTSSFITHGTRAPLSTTQDNVPVGTSSFITHGTRPSLSTTQDPVPAYDPSVKSPCSVENIPSSRDVFVNCRSRSISRIDSRWFPANTTSLNLDENNINRLENNTFFHLRFLRNLSICCSNVAEIQIKALRGLASLDYLNLEDNKLPLREKAFPNKMFSYVPNLRHLYIQNNRNSDSYANSKNIDDMKNCSEVTPYHHYIDMFDTLQALESLSIDTFPHVCLGQEFSKLHHLKNLQLYGSTNSDIYSFLTNNTFFCLKNVKLVHLSMSNFHLPVHTDVGLFQYLEHLGSLSLSATGFGNQLVAKLMWPFVNKTMSSIYLFSTAITRHLRTPYSVFEDGIIGRETMKYLGNICVADFAWIGSLLNVFEPGVLNTPTWRRCLKALDVSDNEEETEQWRIVWLDILSLSALESLTVSHPIPYGTDYQINTRALNFNKVPRNNRGRSRSGEQHANARTNIADDETDHSNKTDASSVDYVNVSFTDAASSLTSHGADMLRTPNRVFLNIDNGNLKEQDGPGWLKEGQLIVWLPHHIRRLRFVHTTDHNVFSDDFTYVIKGADNFQEFYTTHMPDFIQSSARILGFEHLKLWDISYSLLKVRRDFFDDFPGIEILVLRSILPKNYFDSVMPCKQLIRKMSNLRYLDITDNGLNFLLPGTFSANSELIQLYLADNRFSSIPFDLHLTPKLKVLDLSQNAILYLDEDARAAIDAHVTKVDEFYLKLEGNGLVCVCSQMAFLVWLDTTNAILDKPGQYNCTSEDGSLSHTVSRTDLPGFWRHCNGWSWLMTSIVLALVLMVSFLTTYLTARFRCAIKAFTMRLMFPQFRPLRPEDYKTDIIVCYADDDFRFVRNILLSFLEDELQLRTHVHQRDLPVGGHADDHIHKAIENSWRIMLVITETFLRRYDMADIMMKFACYAVGPANQGRVFTVVEQNQLNFIPRNLHAVLDDDRIIVVHDLGDPLGYEQKQSIKNCLRSVN